MRRTLPALLLFILLAPALAAQTRRMERGLEDFYTYGDNYFLEVNTFPGPNPAKGRAVVTFRLTYDLLSFRKMTQAYRPGGSYMATPTLYFEAIGPDGVIVDRANWRDTARVEDYALTNSKKDFLPGAVELALRPGIYTIKYVFDNGTPGSGFSQTTPPFRMDDFRSPSPAIGMPMFLSRRSGDTLVTTSVDGAALFGRPFMVYVPLASQSEPGQLHYELQTIAKGSDDRPRTLRSGFGSILGRVTASDARAAGNDISYLLRRGDTDSGVPEHAYGAIIQTTSDDLAVGDYLLLLHFESGSNSVVDSVNFKLRWVDMPISLSRPDYAIRALYPIATDEIIEAMLDGSRDQQRRAVEHFWAGRDPTPDTKFNEAMNEYYSRVDYAFFNFKSIGQTDGTFTDRGKIYVLYGPPSEIRREMQPEGPPREVWIYRNRVGRRFIFADESRSGAYRLVEYNDL